MRTNRPFIVVASTALSLFFFASGCARNADGDRAGAGEPEILTADAVDWIATVGDESVERKPLPIIALAEDADVVVDTSSPRQRIDGFGGAFNEAGWKAMEILSPEDRDGVIRALFHPEEGAALTMARMPIGASDYALERYTHNETSGDYSMEHFSIDRDRKYLLPYIKSAMEYVPDLPVWASAWTPPTWMKDNGGFNGGKMLDEPDVYDAYALYLALFVEAYRAEGVNLYEVAVQNEPKILTPYPTCEWDPEQFTVFIREHLGPLLDERGLEVGVMLGTFNFGNEFPSYIRPLLSDPAIAKHVTSVGFQWNGVMAVAATAAAFPGVDIVQTETECGNWGWYGGAWDTEIPGFVYNPERPQNDYWYADYTWSRMRDYFREGVNSYFMWNMVLDEEGKNNNREHPWPQNAAIVVDRESGEAVLTPMYRAFRHFSRYVRPGAVYLPTTKGGDDAVSFLNPDGTVVVAARNHENEAVKIVVDVGGKGFSAELPPGSFHTFLVREDGK